MSAHIPEHQRAAYIEAMQELQAHIRSLEALNSELLAACKLALDYWYCDHPNDTVEAHIARRRIEATVAKADARG